MGLKTTLDMLYFLIMVQTGSGTTNKICLGAQIAPTLR